ncbi:sulfite exporter TauE/SafE family protein [Pseudonocardia spinosispora]|uniref:sulfite exporter TauE/SafE family protein n=1 Tax=Pseudonocardia spinosispora TaxID=103441 RepID=UPI000409C216|nr:sulfite exporter TauE/SafE family protein [Pseudonocardia spinosispora]
MHLDLSLSVAGLLVGFLVGLTGMGGGALLTPLLVLFFRVAPLAAISSDLLTSLVMKPVGGAVHLRQRTVDWKLVGWLTLGSVPSAFAGAVLIGAIGHSAGVQGNLKVIIGVALCASVAMMVARQLLDRRNRRRDALDGQDEQPLVIRPLRTIVIGVVGGFAVGMTSVGAGSVIIALLLLAYPTLRPAKLVGTDIVQAIPLVAAATLGHLLFGDVQFALTTALLLGALPGVYLGAKVSAQGPAAVIRPVVTAVLLASALALLNVGTPFLIAAAVVGFVVMAVLTPRTRTARPVTEKQLDPVH